MKVYFSRQMEMGGQSTHYAFNFTLEGALAAVVTIMGATPDGEWSCTSHIMGALVVHITFPYRNFNFIINEVFVGE